MTAVVSSHLSSKSTQKMPRPFSTLHHARLSISLCVSLLLLSLFSLTSLPFSPLLSVFGIIYTTDNVPTSPVCSDLLSQQFYTDGCLYLTSTSYATFANTGANKIVWPPTGTDFTITFWVQPPTTPIDATLVCVGDTPTANQQIKVGITSSNEFFFSFGPLDPGVKQPSSVSFADAVTWGFVAVTYRAPNGGDPGLRSLYSGSSFTLTFLGSDVPATFPVPNGNQQITVGAGWNSGTPSTFYGGRIDELRIYLSALSQAELTTGSTLNRWPNPVASQLQAWYTFFDAGGTTVLRDATDNQRHMALAGTGGISGDINTDSRPSCIRAYYKAVTPIPTIVPVGSKLNFSYYSSHTPMKNVPLAVTFSQFQGASGTVVTLTQGIGRNNWVPLNGSMTMWFTAGNFSLTTAVTQALSPAFEPIPTIWIQGKSEKPCSRPLFISLHSTSTRRPSLQIISCLLSLAAPTIAFVLCFFFLSSFTS